MTNYKMSSYPDATIGNHYSIDFELGGNWYVRELFKTRKEAEKRMKELNELHKPIDKS